MAKGYNLTVQLNIQGPKNLNSVINNINQKLNNVQASVNVKVSPQTAQALQGISQQARQVKASADEASNAMEAFGKSAGLAVKRFGAFTAATVGFYAVTRATQQSLEKFIEYDKQLTRIAQVTNSSRDSLSSLSSTITSLSTSLGSSSAELATIAVTLSQAGLSAKQTEQALKALALTDLAPTFNNLNQTVEGSIALMKQFSISTNQLESALGSINAVAGSFAVEASDLITAVQRAGGVFAAASQGVSEGTNALNEFLAVFTSVRSTTREGAETIATGLRTIFTRLQREDTITALEEFGVTLTDLEGKFVGPYRAIEQLSQGLRKLDPRSLEFSGIVEELGGFRQVGKVIPLIQRFTTAQQALNVAQEGSGSLAKDAALGQETLAVKISKVQQEFDALIRSIGETSEFRQFIQLSLDLASALIQVADAVKPVIPALAALGAAKVLGGVPSIARGFKKGLGFNTGGFVPGVGNTDTVEAALTPGEYVIRKAAVKAIGKDTLERVNRTGKLPGYNKGGQVEAQNLSSSYVQKKITRAGTQEEYTAGQRINARDRINFQVESLPIDASKKIGNTEFEQRVAATLGGQWKGGNAPVDVIAPQGPVEVRNRKSFTPPAELADKLARYYGDSALTNKMQLDNINLGKIFVAYNTGKLDEKKRKSIEAEGRSKKIAPKSALKGAKKRGFDFTKRANTGGPISGRDTVDALLTPGEYVINERAARSLGRQTLDRLNKADKIGFNKGGAVGPVRLNKGGPPGSASTSGANNNGSVLDSTLVKLVALQAAVSGLNAVIGDETVATSKVTGTLQGLASGVTTGITAFQVLQASGKKTGKLAGASAVALGALTAFDGVVKSLSNSASEFTVKVEGEKFSKALDTAGNALDTFTKSLSQAAEQNFSRSIQEAITSANAVNAAESGRRGSVRQYVLDFFGSDPELARLAPDREAAASRVRANQGMTSAYTEFVDPQQFNREVEAELAKTKQQAAERNKEISDLLLRRAEFKVGKGQTARQSFDELKQNEREAIARSNQEVASQIDQARRAQSATSDENEKKRIENEINELINKEAKRQLNLRLTAVIEDRALRQAKARTDILQLQLSKVFNSIEQAFKAVASNTEARFARASDALSASLGKTNIGYNNSAMKSVLENPQAFSDKQVESAINKLTPSLGQKGNRIGKLALASTRIEGQGLDIINRVLTSSGKTGQRAFDTIGSEFKNMIRGMNLGADIEGALLEQIDKAFKAARGDLGANASSTDVTTLALDILKDLPAFNQAKDLMIQGFNTVSSAQKQYSQSIQQITDAVLQQREYLNRAVSIRREGDLRLREVKGETIGLGDIIRNTLASVAEQTGGETSVEKLLQKQQALLARREQIVERRDAVSGDPSRNEEFIRLTQSLADLDVQLAQNRSGLETLANSTEIASAALNRIQEIQARAQDKLNFFEKAATSTPGEFAELERVYNSLESLSAGIPLTMQNSMSAQNAMFQEYMRSGNPLAATQAGSRALASEKAAALSLLKELKPFFGDNNKAFNQQYEAVLRTLLANRGGPRFREELNKAFQEKNLQDQESKNAIAVYNRAIDVQQGANEALAALINPVALLTTSNDTLRQSIDNLSLRINTIQGMPAQAPPPAQNPRQPIVRQSGGVVYANKGQYVEMKPKGTDTIPAMLTEGEFVVNAKATKKHRGLLEHLNNGGRPSFSNGVAYARPGGMMIPRGNAYGAYTGYNADFDREQAYYRYLYMYRQMYGLGVQKLIPIQARRSIRMAVLREEQRQAYLAQDSTQEAFYKQYDLAEKNRIETYNRMGRKTPEQVKQELLASTDNADTKNKINAIYDPAKIYNMAKKRGININSKAQQVSSSDNSLAARRKANLRKREERETEREARQKEQSPGIATNEEEKLAVPAGPEKIPQLPVIPTSPIQTPKPGTSEFDTYEGVGKSPKYGTPDYKDWEKRRQARIDAELKQLGPKPKFGTSEYNIWKSNKYTIEHREGAAARAASKRERERYYEEKKRAIDARTQQEMEERNRLAQEEKTRNEQLDAERQERIERARGRLRPEDRNKSADQLIKEARDIQAGITSTPEIPQDIADFLAPTTNPDGSIKVSGGRTLTPEQRKKYEEHKPPEGLLNYLNRGVTELGLQAEAAAYGALKSVVPTVVGAGTATLTSVGSLGVGTIPGIGAGVIAGMATSAAQENYLNAIMPEFNKYMNERMAERGIASTLGAVAGGGLTRAGGNIAKLPNMLKGSVGTRVASSAFGAGLNVTTEGARYLYTGQGFEDGYENRLARGAVIDFLIPGSPDSGPTSTIRAPRRRDGFGPSLKDLVTGPIQDIPRGLRQRSQATTARTNARIEQSFQRQKRLISDIQERYNVSPEIAELSYREWKQLDFNPTELDGLVRLSQGRLAPSQPRYKPAGPSSKGSGELSAVPLPKSKPPIKSSETTATKKPQEAKIPKIVQNSALADVWPKLSEPARKAAEARLEKLSKATAAREARRTPKPKVTTEEPEPFIGPTAPQGKPTSGRRIEIDPREFGFTDFATEAAPVSRGIPVRAGTGIPDKPIKLTDIIPESGLETAASRTTAKPTGLQPIPGTTPFNAGRTKGFGGGGEDFIPTATTRPRPQTRAKSTGSSQSELDKARFGFGLLTPEQEFQAVLAGKKPAAIIDGNLTDAQKTRLMDAGLEYAPNPGFVKGGSTSDSFVIGADPQIERFRLLATNVREGRMDTGASRSALGRLLGYSEDSTALFTNPKKPDLDTIQNRINEGFSSGGVEGGERALAEMLKEARAKARASVPESSPPPPAPKAPSRPPKSKPSAAQEILSRSDRDEAKKQLILFKNRLTDEDGPKPFSEVQRDVALRNRPLNDTERAFMEEFERMPRELDQFRTRNLEGFIGQVQQSKKAKTQFDAERDARIEQLRGSGTVPKPPPTKRFTVDEESDLIEVFGLDAFQGRIHTPLYQIPRSLVKGDQEKLLEEFTKRGYQRFSSGGIVKPKYFSSGGLASGDFQELAKGTDRYPAMLRRHEMVMTPEATKRNLGLLKALNRSRGGLIKNGITYAAGGTDGGIGVSAAGNGELRITGNINVTPGDIPNMTQPSGGSVPTDPTPALVSAIQTSNQVYNTAAERIVSSIASSGQATVGSLERMSTTITTSSQMPGVSTLGMSGEGLPLGGSLEGITDMATPLNDLNSNIISLITSLASTSSSGTSSAQTTPQLDFSSFTNGISNFSSAATPLISAIQTLSGTNFGVFIDGAQKLVTGASLIGSSFARFDNAVSAFSQQTSNLISQLTAINLNADIEVGGNITVEPLQITIENLDAIEAQISGMSSIILVSIANALAADNPGINVNSLRAAANG